MTNSKYMAAPTNVGELPLPIPPDVLKRLHFNSSEGLIWLDDRRMVLMHAEAMGALRQELIESLGAESARGLMTRFGYAAGCRDARTSMKIRCPSEGITEFLTRGGQFHTLQGVLVVEQIQGDLDVEQGRCNLEFNWRNSFEAQVHTATYGIGGKPVCWSALGYASGFLSTCMGKRILVREVSCCAMGDEVCHCIAKPVEAWTDAEQDLSYFEPGPVVFAPYQPRSTAQSVVAEPQAEVSCSRPGVIGASAPFVGVMHKIRRVASTNATVLLLGESGVGKSVFAREVQRAGRRAGKPFIEVNCAAIPESLMESELFGVERGAFTGAAEARPGRFLLADGGTLFLDEIATLSLTAQGKLLRVIQTGEFEALGGTKTHKVDVRIITATNEGLSNAVREGRFREDLFYRLNVFPIVIPPLRDRRDDIPPLLEQLIRHYNALHGRRISGVTSQALQVILSYHWPGNVRELENVIERGIILCDDDQPLGYHQLFALDGDVLGQGPLSWNELGLLAEQEIPTAALNVAGGRGGAETEALNAWAEGVVQRSAVSLDEVENSLVRAAFHTAGGNMSKAAGLLGVTRAQLAYRIKKLQSVSA